MDNNDDFLDSINKKNSDNQNTTHKKNNIGDVDNKSNNSINTVNNSNENNSDNSNSNQFKLPNNCKVILFLGNWNSKIVKEKKNQLFVFGDNDLKMGKKGQACIRLNKNTHGIPTKKKPSTHLNSYYNDDEFDLNKSKIDNAFQELLEKSKSYDFIVFPSGGIGTGLSELDKRAPKTFKYLQTQINNLIKYNK